MNAITYMFIGLFILAFFTGLVLGFLFHYWLISMQTFSGTMRIIKDGNKTVYSLELDENPEMLAFKPLVIFKIDTFLKDDSDRE